MTGMFSDHSTSSAHAQAQRQLEYIALDCGLNFKQQDSGDIHTYSANTYTIDTYLQEIVVNLGNRGEGAHPSVHQLKGLGKLATAFKETGLIKDISLPVEANINVPMTLEETVYSKDDRGITARFHLAVEGREIYDRLSNAAQEVHKRIGRELGVKRGLFT